MIFCIGDKTLTESDLGYQKNYRIFNQSVTKREYEQIKSELIDIELPICVWVDKRDITDKEKANNSSWEQTGGLLKTLDYEAAWKQWWTTAQWRDKNKILNLPHFDKNIFKQITGIDKII